MPFPAVALAALVAVASPDPCAHAQTQLALNDCTAREAAALDRRVSAAYTDLLAHVPPSARPLIVRAQSAWRGYREATCRSTAALFAGGTIAPMQYSSCLARLDAERLAYLRWQRNPQTAPPG